MKCHQSRSTIDGYYYMAEEANEKSFTPDGFYLTGDKLYMGRKNGRYVVGQEDENGHPRRKSCLQRLKLTHGAFRKSKRAALSALDETPLGNRISAFLVLMMEAWDQFCKSLSSCL